MELTPEEKKAIASLERVAKKWPESLWLFSASGTLLVMKCGPDGSRAHKSHGCVDQDYQVGSIDIPNDGGDF